MHPQKYGVTVTGIDKDAKAVTLSDGRRVSYESLISTLPLDVTLAWLGKREWADGLSRRCVGRCAVVDFKSVRRACHAQAAVRGAGA